MSCRLRTCLNTLKIRTHAHRTTRLLACCSLRKYSKEVTSPTGPTPLSSPPPVPAPENVEILEPDDGRFDPLSVSFRFKKLRKNERLKENDVKQLFPNAVSYDLPRVYGQSTLMQYGIITFSSASTAKEVIKEMNGKVLENGAVLYVDKALRPSQEWLTLDQIEIPKKIKRSPTAILEALSATVGKDYSVNHYAFVDDPLCFPRTKKHKSICLQAKQSGKEAAQYIIKNYSDNFTFNETDPKIEAYNPKSENLELEGTSEESLLECIQKKKVFDAIAMHTDCLASNIKISEDTNLRLLDLLTLYNCSNPEPEESPHDIYFAENLDTLGSTLSAKKGWNENGYAEKLFTIMSEGDQLSPRAYNMLLKGRAQYLMPQKALELYQMMKEKNIPVEVGAYNKLIPIVFSHPSRGQHKNVLDLYRDMKKAGVSPNHQSFHSYLNALHVDVHIRKQDHLGQMLKVLKEMKIVGLDPCLATWIYVYKIAIGRTDVTTTKSKYFRLNLIRQILDNVEGKIFTPMSPDDYSFFHYFSEAVNKVLDIDSTNRLHNILHTGNNYRFLNTHKKEQKYHYHYFDTIKEFEPVDVIVEKVNEMSPTATPSTSAWFLNYLESNLNCDAGFQSLPTLWSGMIYTSVTSNSLVEFYLRHMAWKKHTPELQEKFVEIVSDLFKQLTNIEDDGTYLNVTLNASITEYVIMIYLYADLEEEAWNVFEYFFNTEGISGSISTRIVAHKLLKMAIEKKDLDRCIICLKYVAQTAVDEQMMEDLKQLVLSSTFQTSISDSNRKLIESINKVQGTKKKRKQILKKESPKSKE